MTSKNYKIIGFDLDDVLLDFNKALCEYNNLTYGTSHKREDVTTYDLEELWGCNRGEVIKRIFDFYQSPAHMRVLPISGAVEGIRALKKDNVFHIITAKPDILRSVTQQWLDKYFPGIFESVHFTNSIGFPGIGRTKAEVCNELGVEIFVDDSMDNAKNVSSVGIPVLLLNSPWNQGEVSQLVTRVNSWQEIVDKLS